VSQPVSSEQIESPIVQQIMAKLKTIFTAQDIRQFLIGWKIDVDSANMTTLEVIDCDYDHDGCIIVSKNIGHKFKDDDEYQAALQEMLNREGRCSKEGFTRLPLRLIQTDGEVRQRYGGTWMPPNPMLMTLAKTVVSNGKIPHVEEEEDTTSRARELSDSVTERKAACLARLRANRQRWASALGPWSSDTAWIWSRLIRDAYGMRASGILTEWEVDFLGSLVRASYEPTLRLSPRQQKILTDIGQKLITKAARA